MRPADLSGYVDGDLGPWRHWRVRRHLVRCEACRRYVEQLHDLRRLAAGLPGIALTPQLRDRLVAARASWVEHEA